MLDAFEKCIFEFCLPHGLLADCGRLLAAVSGGADSVALLYGLKQLKDEGAIDCELSVAHINHNLRGSDSDGDEEFVKDLAGELGIQCITRSVDVKGYAAENKLSIETAARDLRIACLMEMADSLNCNRIATAHHADDNAETMIYRMNRGTGFKGLCGINPETVFTVNDRSVTFIRPLLNITKEQIVAYCQECGIDWRHDHTNDEFDYTRNRIRHLVIPYLLEQSEEGHGKQRGHGPPYEVNPKSEGYRAKSFVEYLKLLSGNCQKLYDRIEQKIESHQLLFGQLDCGGVSIDGVILKTLSPIIQAEVIRMALVKVGCGQRDITRKHYRNIIGLLTGEGGKVIELPGEFRAKLEFGKILLYSLTESTDEAVYKEERVKIKIPGTVEFGGYKLKTKIIDAADCDLSTFIAEKNSNVEWFDMDKIEGPVYARKRKEGDKFVPIGMSSEKKVGKFLTAERIDYQLRDNLIVLEDELRIIWVGPVRASEETRVGETTIKILELEISST